MRIRTTVVSMAVCLALLAGCTRTSQVTDEPSTSGFLGDHYAKLTPGEGQYAAALEYVNSAADFRRYNAVLLDPVLFYSGGYDKGSVSRQDRQTLANNFYVTLADQLVKDFKMVGSAQTGTLHMRVAITDAARQKVVLDTVSTVVPVGAAVKAAKQKFTGEPGFTGALAIEFALTDANTGTLMVAGVDRRVGALGLSKDQLQGWSDVEAVMALYSQIARYRLCQLRQRGGCVAPEE